MKEELDLKQVLARIGKATKEWTEYHDLCKKQGVDYDPKIEMKYLLELNAYNNRLREIYLK